MSSVPKAGNTGCRQSWAQLSKLTVSTQEVHAGADKESCYAEMAATMSLADLCAC